MRQFIPFEDDWDALANRRIEELVPYSPGMFSRSEIKVSVAPPMIDQLASGKCEERESTDIP